MAKRAYTVKEIEALRCAVENKYLYGRYTLPSGSGYSRSFSEKDMAVTVEQQVRTFMAAGLTAQDLYESERRPRERTDQLRTICTAMGEG